MPVTRGERPARALFAATLHLYPASYRDEYGREMTLVLVDRLRAELEHDLRGTTSCERDPRGLTSKVYYGLVRFVGSGDGPEEHWQDDFAAWVLDGE